MSKTLVPLASGSSDVVFELERFELSGEDRLELSGRWFGVRGRRFIRPTLTLVADGENYRALADLVHKPWAAEDGEPWEAAFVCGLGGAEVVDAELTVTPDITVSLPAFGGSGGEGTRETKRPRRDRAAIAARQRALGPESPRRSARPTEDDAALRRACGLADAHPQSTTQSREE